MVKLYAKKTAGWLKTDKSMSILKDFKLKGLKNLISVGLIGLSVLAIIKSILIGFDIDEAYAVAQSYRLVVGDAMFAQMWEPHQMSAFGSAIFILPFLWITGGSTTGIVLYLRIVGSVIHVLLGWWFYRTARKHFGTTAGLMLALVHINFLPKWVSLPEFEIMQYWAVCVLFLALLEWKDCGKRRYLVISGAALFVAVMCYPTMLLLYPVYVIAIFRLREGRPKEKVMSALWFTLPPLALGIGLLIYLFSYMALDEFVRYISYIFMDESHSVSISERFALYGGELEVLWERLKEFLPGTLLATVCIAVVQIIEERKGKLSKERRVSFWIIILFLFWISAFVIEQIRASFFDDVNQFYLYFRFLLIVVLGIVGAIASWKECKAYFWLGILPGMVGVFASALLTNMSLEIATARIYIGVIGTCFVMCTLLKGKFNAGLVLKWVSYGTVVLFVLGLLVCKLLLVRVTGCIPISIKMHMDLVTEGPAAGLLLKEELAQQYNVNVPVIEESVYDSDKLLYFGCENLYYLVTDATIATPSVQGTTVFDEVFLQYYKEHPDRMPNVVIIDKGFSTNPYYGYSSDNQIVLDWIMEEFAEAEVVETDYFTIYRKE